MAEVGVVRYVCALMAVFFFFFFLVGRLGLDWDATVTGGDIDRTGGKNKTSGPKGASQSPTRVCNGVVSVCAWRDK